MEIRHRISEVPMEAGSRILEVPMGIRHRISAVRMGIHSRILEVPTETRRRVAPVITEILTGDSRKEIRRDNSSNSGKTEHIQMAIKVESRTGSQAVLRKESQPGADLIRGRSAKKITMC